MLKGTSRASLLYLKNGASHHWAPIRQRAFTTTSPARATGPPDISRTRNIGIIAHIDAGKTTTTERMLYYSGYTRRLGDVDEGSTVTDFLPAERARGITIQSAAITFQWPPIPDAPTQSPGHAQTKPRTALSGSSSRPSPAPLSHTINLIDTPGHADFTFEVIRSLRILDGAICILDGVAGVEAQTEQVWKQADALGLPRIIYINKLDRDGAEFARTVREIAIKLRGLPALCQIPWWKNGRFVGIGDVVHLRALRWPEQGDGTNAEVVTLRSLRESVPDFARELLKARTALIDALSGHDESMVEQYLENEDASQIPPTAIIASLRECTLDGSARLIPVFCGASFRNIGVQPLLDAVNDLLPSPEDRPPVEISTSSPTVATLQSLTSPVPISATSTKTKGHSAVPPLNGSLQACALAFKVVSDPRRGLLTYVRVYHGSISRSALLYNTSLGTAERVTRLLHMYASDAVDIPSIDNGQIGVIPGLKHARTGDTLIVCQGMGPKTPPPAQLKDLQLRPIDVPPPVFFASLEPASLSEEKTMKENLNILLREDPSLRVTTDPENGQTMIAGMGELHLEIARDRLIGEFRTRAEMGNVRVAYRECPIRKTEKHRETCDQEIGGVRRRAACEVWMEPDEAEHLSVSGDDKTISSFVRADGNSFDVSIIGSPRSDEEADSRLRGTLDAATISAALIAGASAALTMGPRFHVPMHSVLVHLRFDMSTDFFSDTETVPAALSSAARQTTAAALRSLCSSVDDDGTALMDPLMSVNIAVDEENMGTIVSDISNARGGQILSLDDESVNTQLDERGSNRPEIDLTRLYNPPDPYGSVVQATADSRSSAGGRQRTISAFIPLKEMVGYLKHLRSMTKGRGSFTMTLARFEKMSKQRERNVLREFSGT